MRPKGFTLLELLVTLLLGTLLLLLIYQVFGQVAQDFLALKQGRDFSLFLKASEGLRRQLEALDNSPVNIAGRQGSLFSWQGGLLCFLTDFGPGGKMLVIYRKTREGLLYAELPYTGQRLPEDLWSAVTALPHPPIFALPGMKITLLKITDQDTQEISSWRGIPGPGDHLFLEISAQGHKRLFPLGLEPLP